MIPLMAVKGASLEPGEKEIFAVFFKSFFGVKVNGRTRKEPSVSSLSLLLSSFAHCSPPPPALFQPTFLEDGHQSSQGDRRRQPDRGVHAAAAAAALPVASAPVEPQQGAGKRRERRGLGDVELEVALVVGGRRGLARAAGELDLRRRGEGGGREEEAAGRGDGRGGRGEASTNFALGSRGAAARKRGGGMVSRQTRRDWARSTLHARRLPELSM